MATEPSASASAPQPATAKPAAAASKGPNFMILLFTLGAAVVIALAANILYDERRSISWFIELVFKLAVPGLAIYLATLFIKKKIDGH